MGGAARYHSSTNVSEEKHFILISIAGDSRLAVHIAYKLIHCCFTYIFLAKVGIQLLGAKILLFTIMAIEYGQVENADSFYFFSGLILGGVLGFSIGYYIFADRGNAVGKNKGTQRRSL
ncbi:hypothetical protein Ddc_02467 [Ditylenchus destructor]|nr:hypothetical protein Ddc_02467 [Ditylenchus destructor]